MYSITFSSLSFYLCKHMIGAAYSSGSRWEWPVCSYGGLKCHRSILCHKTTYEHCKNGGWKGRPNLHGPWLEPSSITADLLPRRADNLICTRSAGRQDGDKPHEQMVFYQISWWALGIQTSVSIQFYTWYLYMNHLFWNMAPSCRTWKKEMLNRSETLAEYEHPLFSRQELKISWNKAAECWFQLRCHTPVYSFGHCYSSLKVSGIGTSWSGQDNFALFGRCLSDSPGIPLGRSGSRVAS